MTADQPHPPLTPHLLLSWSGRQSKLTENFALGLTHGSTSSKTMPAFALSLAHLFEDIYLKFWSQGISILPRGLRLLTETIASGGSNQELSSLGDGDWCPINQLIDSHHSLQILCMEETIIQRYLRDVRLLALQVTQFNHFFHLLTSSSTYHRRRPLLLPISSFELRPPISCKRWLVASHLPQTLKDLSCLFAPHPLPYLSSPNGYSFSSHPCSSISRLELPHCDSL
jgi:hypothetical protein